MLSTHPCRGLEPLDAAGLQSKLIAQVLSYCTEPSHLHSEGCTVLVSYLCAFGWRARLLRSLVAPLRWWRVIVQVATLH